MNVLCLHGFGQSADLITSKVKSILTPKSNYNIIGCNGCVILGDNRYGWWIHDYIGLSNSANKIIDICDKLGDYMVIGFSQGGCILDYLISNNLITPKYCIFIGTMPHPTEMTFMETDYTIEEYPGKEIHQKTGNIKFLHVIGMNDEIINPELSNNLALKHPGIIYTHQGRHVIPNNSGIRNEIKKMI